MGTRNVFEKKHLTNVYGDIPATFLKHPSAVETGCYVNMALLRKHNIAMEFESSKISYL